MKVASGRLCPSDGDVPVCRIGVVLFLLIDKDSQGHGVQTSPRTAESRSPFINYSFPHVPSCSLLQTLNHNNFFNVGNHVYLSIHSLRYPLSISTLIRYSIFFQNLVFPLEFFPMSWAVATYYSCCCKLLSCCFVASDTPTSTICHSLTSAVKVSSVCHSQLFVPAYDTVRPATDIFRTAGMSLFLWMCAAVPSLLFNDSASCRRCCSSWTVIYALSLPSTRSWQSRVSRECRLDRAVFPFSSEVKAFLLSLSICLSAHLYPQPWILSYTRLFSYTTDNISVRCPPISFPSDAIPFSISHKITQIT